MNGKMVKLQIFRAAFLGSKLYINHMRVLRLFFFAFINVVDVT